MKDEEIHRQTRAAAEELLRQYPDVRAVLDRKLAGNRWRLRGLGIALALAILAILALLLASSRADAITCPGSLDFPRGACLCQGPFPGYLEGCWRLPTGPLGGGGGCSCQNAWTFIACDGPESDYCPVTSVCQCSAGSAPCLGTFVGGPADGRACYLMPPSNTALTLEQKQAMSDLAYYYSLMGVPLVACRHTACIVAAGVLTAASVGLETLARIDPPDPNYLEIAPTIPVAFTPLVQTCQNGTKVESYKRCSVTLAEADAANALAGNLAAIAGVEDAMVTTVNRLSTAIADLNAEGIALQIDWFNFLKAKLATKLPRTAPLRIALGAVLNQRQTGLGDAWLNSDATAAELALATVLQP